jgi:hypothetical protein
MILFLKKTYPFKLERPIIELKKYYKNEVD